MTSPTDIPALIERLRARGSEPYLGNDYLWHAQLEPIFAEAATALASMAEQVARLEAALEPFAEYDGYNDWCPDEIPAWHIAPIDEDDMFKPSSVTVGDLRRARALTTKGGEDG